MRAAARNNLSRIAQVKPIHSNGNFDGSTRLQHCLIVENIGLERLMW